MLSCHPSQLAAQTGLPPSPTPVAMPPTLLVLMGLPASGKSTWARSFLSYAAAECPQSVWRHVEVDAWIGEFTSPEQWRHSREAALGAASQYLVQGSSVIFDDNNYYHSMRKDCRRLADQSGCNFVLISFEHVALSTCVERNQQRPSTQLVPLAVMESMHEKMEVVRADEKLFCCLEHDHVSVRDFLLQNIYLSYMQEKTLQEEENEKERLREQECKAQHASWLEQVDLRLRKQVHALCTAHPQQSQLYNKWRRQMLQQLQAMTAPIEAEELERLLQSGPTP